MKTILIIIGIVAILGAIAYKIFCSKFFEENTYNTRKKLSSFVILLGLLIIVLANSFIFIPTGYTGVRITFGQIDSKPVSNGFNWTIPFIQSIEQINNKQQDKLFGEGRIYSETKERTTVYYENITISFKVNPEKSAWIYANVDDYQNLVTENLVTSSIKRASKLQSDTDATSRSVMEPLIAKNLQAGVNEKYGKGVITIIKAIIENGDFEESYNKALAKKQQAQIEAKTQKIQNEKKIAKAEADATVKKTKAKAKAEATLIEAEAQSKANKLLEKSLTSDVLKKLYLEKWDGKLPTYTSNGNSGMLFSITDKTN